MTTGRKTPGRQTSNGATPQHVCAAPARRVLLTGSPRCGYVVPPLTTLTTLCDDTTSTLVVRRARVGIEQCAPLVWVRAGGRVELVVDVVAEVERADVVVIASAAGDEVAEAVIERAAVLGVPVALHWSGAYPWPSGEESAAAQVRWSARARAVDRNAAERRRVRAA